MDVSGLPQLRACRMTKTWSEYTCTRGTRLRSTQLRTAREWKPSTSVSTRAAAASHSGMSTQTKPSSLSSRALSFSTGYRSTPVAVISLTSTAIASRERLYTPILCPLGPGYSQEMANDQARRAGRPRW